MSSFRYRLVQVLLILAFLAIALRLFQFQILEGHKYRKVAQRANPDLVSRGEIVDRNQKVLCIDLNKYTLEYNPAETKEDRYQLAARLSEIIGFNRPELLNSNSSMILAHNLTSKQARSIRALHSKLLYLRKIKNRFYPQGSLASHILGFVDIYGKARQGVESSFEKELIENSTEKFEISIDSRLQVFAENALAKRIEDTKANRGTVLVMDVHTGEILAWAVEPDFDPNKYYDYPFERTKNWALVDVYQPGSIFKIITVSSALDSGTIGPDYTFNDVGFLEVERWKIKNHDYIPGKTPAKLLSLQELFERSSNPFSAHLALKMGPAVFYRYIRKFGFAQKTNIELEGETKGILRNFRQWKKSDTATTGFGQGAISVTPLQMVTAVNVIANGGFWVKPTLKKVNPQIVNEKKSNLKPVIKPETAKLVARLLAGSVEQNIKLRYSIAGNIPGLRVAGKTGTAEKIKDGGGYSKSQTVASFLGFFPAENPQFIVLAVVDDPKAAGGWGDTVAGPLFNEVASYVKALYL
jgi:cell division protein FtsI/penicillin-binding protein 2